MAFICFGRVGSARSLSTGKDWRCSTGNGSAASLLTGIDEFSSTSNGIAALLPAIEDGAGLEVAAIHLAPS